MEAWCKFKKAFAIVLLLSSAKVNASGSVGSYEPTRVRWQSFIKGFNFFLTKVGVELIHDEPSAGLRIRSLVPLPEPSLGHIEDFNAYQFDSHYPDTFTLSDSTYATPFIYVDNREGSELNVWLKKKASDLRSRFLNQEGLINELKTYISSQVLLEVPVNDLVLSVFSDLKNSTISHNYELDNLRAGHYPIDTRKSFPTVSLLDVIKYGRGFCIHKALLTSLILKELGIKNNLRFGSTGQSGHTWIELENQWVLDPTWNLLVQKRPHSIKGSQNLELYFNHNGTDMIVLQYYPFAVWK